MLDLEACKKIEGFQKHYTPMDMQKLNFIERKFTVNHLSFDSVVKQFQKTLCIVLALIEQRLIVLYSAEYEDLDGNEPDGGHELIQSMFPHLLALQIRSNRDKAQKMRKPSSVQSDLDKLNP